MTLINCSMQFPSLISESTLWFIEFPYFSHPWETVVQASWRKYPNPINTAVVGTDVVDRAVSEDGVLHTHRLVSSKWYFPNWVQRVSFRNLNLRYVNDTRYNSIKKPSMCQWMCFIINVYYNHVAITCNCHAAEMQMWCNLLSHFSLQIIGTPKVCYASERSTVDPNERQMTLKTTNVTFGSFLSVDEVLLYKPHPTDPNQTLLQQQATVSVEGVPLSTYMEEVLTNNISFNASRGRLGLEWVINKINTEVSHQACHAPNHLTKIYSKFRLKKLRRQQMTCWRRRKNHLTASRIRHANQWTSCRRHIRKFTFSTLNASSLIRLMIIRNRRTLFVNLLIQRCLSIDVITRI